MIPDAPIVAYAAFVGVWFVAYLLWPDRWWPLILLNKVAAYFLYAALPVAVLALASRRSWRASSAVVPVLVTALAATLPHVHVAEDVYGGTTAVLSRYPFDRVREIDFGIDRPAIVADVATGTGRLRVVGAHLYPSYYAYHDRPWHEMPAAIERYIADQHVQVHRLLELVAEDDAAPLVLACDCNTQRTASSHRLLDSALTDAAVTLGWQTGTPVDGARFERDLDHIDYLWYRGDIEPVGLYRTAESGGSDHDPVFADFRFGAGGRPVALSLADDSAATPLPALLRRVVVAPRDGARAGAVTMPTPRRRDGALDETGRRPHFHRNSDDSPRSPT